MPKIRTAWYTDQKKVSSVRHDQRNALQKRHQAQEKKERKKGAQKKKKRKEKEEEAEEEERKKEKKISAPSFFFFFSVCFYILFFFSFFFWWRVFDDTLEKIATNARTSNPHLFQNFCKHGGNEVTKLPSLLQTKDKEPPILHVGPLREACREIPVAPDPNRQRRMTKRLGLPKQGSWHGSWWENKTGRTEGRVPFVTTGGGGGREAVRVGVGWGCGGISFAVPVSGARLS